MYGMGIIHTRLGPPAGLDLVMTALRREATVSRDILVKAFLIALGLIGAVGMGAAMGAHQPLVLSIGLVVAGLLLMPMALSLSGERLILGAVSLALFSRLLVAFGAPPLLNYAHFGLALIALLKLTERRGAGIGTVAFDIGLLGLALAVITSAVANGAHPLRAAFFWLTLIEPFLFLALIMDMEEASRKRLRHFLVALAVAQLPFIGVQFLLHGIGDDVQGTLLDQGAGHHVIGAVGVVAGVLLIAGSRQDDSLRPLRWALAGALLLVGIFSDAKQVYGAVGLATAAVMLSLVHRGMKSLLPLALLLSAIIASGTQFYPALAQAFDIDLMRSAAEGKFDQAQDIVANLGWHGSLLGFGPGNGVSRVALAAVPEYGNVPTAILGDQPSQLASAALAAYPAGTVSSALSPFASWLSIYGDVGILGLAMYLLLGLWVWRSLARSATNERSLGRLLLLFAAVLGLAFMWLEEPAFMLYLAAAIGTCLNPAPRGSNESLYPHRP